LFIHVVGDAHVSSDMDKAASAISKILGCINKSGGFTQTIIVPELGGAFDRVSLDERPGKVPSNYEFYQSADGRLLNVKLFRYVGFDLVKFSTRMVVMTNVVYDYTDPDGIVMKFIVISILFTNCVNSWQKK
jgi:hypothetical protein